MPLSPVQITEKSAFNRALRETIGRQLRANYDTSQPVPKELLAFLQRLQRDEDKSSPLTVVPDTAKSATVVLLADARESRCRRPQRDRGAAKWAISAGFRVFIAGLPLAATGEEPRFSDSKPGAV